MLNVLLSGQRTRLWLIIFSSVLFNIYNSLFSMISFLLINSFKYLSFNIKEIIQISETLLIIEVLYVISVKFFSGICIASTNNTTLLENLILFNVKINSF